MIRNGQAPGARLRMRETRSARIERHPAGCIIVRVLPGIAQTVDHARENLAACVELSGGPNGCPLLVNITNAGPLDSSVRHYYAGVIPENFPTFALVAEASPLGNMMGGVFSRMIKGVNPLGKNGAIPARMFTDEE